MLKKRGQIWMETVIYTLIAFVMIGAVLSVAKPKIESIQDQALIKQSINILEAINIQISSVRETAGNQRVQEIKLKKGTLKIDGDKNQILIEIESNYRYSELGKEVTNGEIKIKTEEKGEAYFITLKKDYLGKYDIKYEEEDELKSLSKSPLPYKIIISNKGNDVINFEVD